MKTLPFPRLLPIVALCLLLPSCVSSLHSLISKDTQVFKPELVGTWTDKNNSWEFRSIGQKLYELTYTDGDGNTGLFQAGLVELDGKLFLDLLPKDLSGEETGYWKFHYLKSHTFLLVEEIGPKLKMRPMNPTWMKEYLEANPDAVQATLVDKRPILTAPTAELQKFVVKLAGMKPNAEGKGPFGEPTDLDKKN